MICCLIHTLARLLPACVPSTCQLALMPVRTHACLPVRWRVLPPGSQHSAAAAKPCRDWAARWTEGDAREYVVQCRDEAEVATYRQLLAFMHSMAKELPQGKVSG